MVVAIVPVTTISPLARFCWKKGDCSAIDAIFVVENVLCGREGELEAVLSRALMPSPRRSGERCQDVTQLPLCVNHNYTYRYNGFTLSHFYYTSLNNKADSRNIVS